MTTFAHANDRTIRIGDHVATREDVPGSVPLLEPSTNPILTEKDAKIGSSVVRWWRSAIKTLGEPLNKEEKMRSTSFVGIVEKVDEDARKVWVKVWKRGKDIIIKQRREVEVVSLARLRKLTLQEFHATCKDAFVMNSNYQLKLKGEGYDETAPLALIAYNNRIVSSLIDKIDTSAKKVVSKLPVNGMWKVRGPGAIKKMEIPTIIPIDDPLASVRAELRQLAAGGESLSKRRVEKVTTAKEQKFDAQRSTKVEQEDELSFSRCTTPGTEKTYSLTEETIAIDGVRAKSALARKLSRGLTGSVKMPTQGLSVSAIFSSPFSQQKATLRVQRRSTSGGNFMKTSLQGNLRNRISCMVSSVAANGQLFLEPLESATTPFWAVLAHIMLLSAPSGGTKAGAFSQDDAQRKDSPGAASTGCEYLQKVSGLSVDVAQLDRDANGITLVEVYMESDNGGEVMLQKELLSEGLAVLSCPLFENASVFFGQEIATSLRGSTAEKQKLKGLFAAQQNAVSNRIGLWAQNASNSNFLPTDSSQPAQTSPAKSRDLWIDEAEEECCPLPPLFPAFESASGFRSQVALHAQRSRK